ncbi:hypothetical protein A2V68_00410 [candidate division Kazan bacterium RBG_13_50_9]|uniref:Uncharacterized protein n=1 Tax=candidate division Kazan bacterium RBG_13_50_9 TaxID=1798535 RepID=A0A1F4NSG3_UNCK3|nr:MAG: hypothetical protein A2V68_00410 [candidate division Kazan bacterium RBG_13_50_9]
MKRKAIYLDVNADLASALLKLAQVVADEVVLVVPKGSALFHSVVNFKILKSESEELGKRLSLVTTDSRGPDFAGRAGITMYQNIDLESTDKNAPPPPPAAESHLQPVVHQPEIRIKYKRKLPRSQLSGQLQPLPTAPMVPYPVEAVSEADAPPPRVRLGSGGLVWLFVAIAVLLLGGVAYFALPHATVHIDLQAEPFTHKFRLVLADQEDVSAAGQNVFKGRFVEVAKEVVQTFPATGSKNLGEKASGTITIYNYTASLKGLIPDTRFVSLDGQVFRIGADVLIGPARGSVPGRAKAKALADEGGSAGNLPADTKFTVPRLGPTGIDLVFGKNEQPFSGGTDEEIKVVSEEDIESARESVSKNVFLDIANQLQAELQRGEELIPALIQNDIIDSVPEVSAGAERETFDLKVQVRSWTLLPPLNKLSDIINNTVTTITPKDQAVTSQTLHGARIILDNADFLMRTLDFTVELDGLVARKVDTSELADAVANRTPQNVAQLLDSIPDVVSHKTVLWPFWIKRLPLLESNIKIDFAYVSQSAPL